MMNDPNPSICLCKHFSDDVCLEKITSLSRSSSLFPSLSSALSSNEGQNFCKEACNLSKNLYVSSYHQKNARMKIMGSNGQFDSRNEKLQQYQRTAHYSDTEGKNYECSQAKRLYSVVNKNQWPKSILTGSTFPDKSRKEHSSQVESSNVAFKECNKGNERGDYSDAVIATIAAVDEDKCKNNYHVYNRMSPITCRKKKSGHGQCGEDDFKDGVIAQKSLALKSSNSQGDSSDNDWFSATETTGLSYCTFCGGGENHRNSRDRGIKTKLVSSPTTTSTSIPSRHFAFQHVTRCKNRQVKRKLLSKSSIYARTSAERNYYSKKYRGIVCYSRNDAIDISSADSVSNFFRRIFKFMLLASFLLLNCTCEVVEGENFSTRANKRLDVFLMHPRNSNYDYNNNIKNVSLRLLPIAVSSPRSNFKNSNLNRNRSFSTRRAAINDNYARVDDHQSVDASLKQVGNERKFSKTSTATASAEETLRDLLSQPLNGLDKDVLLRVSLSSFCWISDVILSKW